MFILGVECDSGTEFRELGRTGIARNYTESLGIPGIVGMDSGIEGNQFVGDSGIEGIGSGMFNIAE